ncbi:MAG: hypothetical protein JST54_15005 [Deltaproteobacteria bacterium]|nr:hypothetical protein [Deltaproteobacteria bacterium]
MYHPQFDQLTAYATGEPFKEQVLAAKAEYVGYTGEVFDDDRSFEPRMASFLEFYLFDRKLPAQGLTPAELFLRERGPTVSPDERQSLEGFTQTLHSIFEVRKLHPGGIRVRELFTGKDHEVYERRSVAGMSKGDILEARLIPNQGRELFAPAFCYHPKEARKAILKELKRQKKKPDPDFTPQKLIFTLSRMALKVERYRNIAVEAIYTFDQKTI